MSVCVFLNVDNMMLCCKFAPDVFLTSTPSSTRIRKANMQRKRSVFRNACRRVNRELVDYWTAVARELTANFLAHWASVSFIFMFQAFCSRLLRSSFTIHSSLIQTTVLLWSRQTSLIKLTKLISYKNFIYFGPSGSPYPQRVAMSRWGAQNLKSNIEKHPTRRSLSVVLRN